MYVYGTGNESSVSVSVNGSNLSKANSRQTRGTTYVTKAKKTVKFTMTAEQAAAAQTSGIKITGSGFVLHAVSVVIVEAQVTPTPTPTTDNIVIYDRTKDGSVSNSGGKVYGDKSLFTQATI